MKDDGKIPTDLSLQNAIEARAAELLIARLHDEDWGAEKQAELDAWLAQSVAHEVAYLRLEAGWIGADRLAVLRAPLRRTPSSEPARPSGTSKFHVAAILVLCAALGTTGYLVSRPTQDQMFATPVGGRETITLADGSQIELNTDTELRLPPGSRRAVLIKGEAYFQIQHDAAHPFILDVGNHKVVDLGTRFVVRQRSDKLEVTVVEGRARLDGPAGTADMQSAILNPGDVAIATQGRLIITKKPPTTLNDALSWRTGFVVFHRTTLSDAANEFNRYSTTKIVIADSRVAQRYFGGKFRTSDAERFASVVGAALGLRVDRKESEIVISGK